MEHFLEALLILPLCAAAGILLYRFATNKSTHRMPERFAAITMGLGFLAGIVTEAIENPVPWIFLMCVFGAYLCYTAVLFSFPEKEGEHE